MYVLRSFNFVACVIVRSKVDFFTLNCVGILDIWYPGSDLPRHTRCLVHGFHADLLSVILNFRTTFNIFKIGDARHVRSGARIDHYLL